MIIWLILLLSGLKFKSISANEIIDITEDFYLNQSVNIKFAFKGSINQSLLTRSFESELTFSNEANYFIILSNVTYFDNSTKPDCNPIFMGYAFPYILPNGDVGIKRPYMQYAFKENEPRQFHDIIPFRLKGERFVLKYFQNKMCTRTKSVLEIFGLFSYATQNNSCPKLRQWMFVLEDNEDKINRTMCINQYPDLKYQLELFGAKFLNYSDEYLTEPNSYSTSDPTIIQPNNWPKWKILLIVGSSIIVLVGIIIITILIRTGKIKCGQKEEKIDSSQKEPNKGASRRISIELNTQQREPLINPDAPQIGPASNAVEDSVLVEESKENPGVLRSISHSNEEKSLSNSHAKSTPRPILEDNVELIPDSKPPGDYNPEGKYIRDFELLGPVVKLSAEDGGYFNPSKEYAESLHHDWKTIRAGKSQALIWSVPYFIQSEKCGAPMIVRFTLQTENDEKCKLKARLLDNNYINKSLTLPHAFTINSKFRGSSTKRKRHQFVCNDLSSDSNIEYISFDVNMPQEGKFQNIHFRI